MTHYHDEYGLIDAATPHCVECGRRREPLAEGYGIWANRYDTLADGEVIEHHLAWLCGTCDTRLRAARCLHEFRDAVLRDFPDAVFIKQWRSIHRAPTADVSLFGTVGYDIGDDE